MGNGHVNIENGQSFPDREAFNCLVSEYDRLKGEEQNSSEIYEKLCGMVDENRMKNKNNSIRSSY